MRTHVLLIFVVFGCGTAAPPDPAHVTSVDPGLTGPPIVLPRAIEAELAANGAEAVAVRAQSDGTDVRVRLGRIDALLRYRERGEHAWFADSNLEAMRWLHRVIEAGVDPTTTASFFLHEDGRTARVTSDEPNPDLALLEQPSWLLPPSQRRPEDDPRAAAEALLLAALNDDAPAEDPERDGLRLAAPVPRGFSLSGLALDADSRLLLVRGHEEQSSLLCLAIRREVRCVATELELLRGLVKRIDDTSWLIRGSSSYGNQRDNTILLAVVRRAEPLRVDHHPLGGMGGEGEHCVDHESYCVHYSGEGYDASLVAPSCLEVRPGQRWSATIVRTTGEWLHETMQPARSCIERFDLSRGFTRANCGPASSVPPCPDA